MWKGLAEEKMAIYFIEDEILEPKKALNDEEFGDLTLFKKKHNWMNY